MEKIISWLLEKSCPSIKYRIKKEILGERDKDLEKELIRDNRVNFFLGLQDKTGWIKEDFHSPLGVETACRVFLEKGLEPSFKPYTQMLKELEKREDSFDNGSLERVGKILDRKGFGGSNMIKASVFAGAGLEDRVFVRDQVAKALECFDFVSKTPSIEQVTTFYRGKKVFQEGVLWPGIYQLRLLAFSSFWRTEKNRKIVRAGIERIIELSPLPSIKVLEKSQIIAPCSFLLNNFKPVLNELSPGEWMPWFHQMEMLARLKIIGDIGELTQQLNELRLILAEGDGFFTRRISHRNFFNWSPYSGMALEKDWRSRERRISDLSFRSFLVNYFSEV